MDFHAVVEVAVDGVWQLYDATGLAPRQTMVRIGTGLDAAGTALPHPDRRLDDPHRHRGPGVDRRRAPARRRPGRPALTPVRHLPVVTSRRINGVAVHRSRADPVYADSGDHEGRRGGGQLSQVSSCTDRTTSRWVARVSATYSVRSPATSVSASVEHQLGSDHHAAVVLQALDLPGVDHRHPRVGDQRPGGLPQRARHHDADRPGHLPQQVLDRSGQAVQDTPSCCRQDGASPGRPDGVRGHGRRRRSGAAPGLPARRSPCWCGSSSTAHRPQPRLAEHLVHRPPDLVDVGPGRLRPVADDRPGRAARPSAEHPPLHRRDVLRLVDDDVGVGAVVGLEGRGPRSARLRSAKVVTPCSAASASSSDSSSQAVVRVDLRLRQRVRAGRPARRTGPLSRGGQRRRPASDRASTCCSRCVVQAAGDLARAARAPDRSARSTCSGSSTGQARSTCARGRRGRCAASGRSPRGHRARAWQRSAGAPRRARPTSTRAATYAARPALWERGERPTWDRRRSCSCTSTVEGVTPAEQLHVAASAARPARCRTARLSSVAMRAEPLTASGAGSSSPSRVSPRGRTGRPPRSDRRTLVSPSDGQHGADVVDEHRRRADDQDAAAAVPVAPGVHQVGDAVQRDRGLARAGPARDDQRAVVGRADGEVLLALDRRDDVAHLRPALAGDRGEERAVADDGAVELGVGVEQLVLHPDDLRGADGDGAAAHHAERVGRRRPVERRRRGSPPVDDDRLLVRGAQARCRPTCSGAPSSTSSRPKTRPSPAASRSSRRAAAFSACTSRS